MTIGVPNDWHPRLFFFFSPLYNLYREVLLKENILAAGLFDPRRTKFGGKTEFLAGANLSTALKTVSPYTTFIERGTPSSVLMPGLYTGALKEDATCICIRFN